MKENHFSEKMTGKSDEDLKYYIENKGLFQDELILAAQWELEKRGLIETVSEPEVSVKADENGLAKSGNKESEDLVHDDKQFNIVTREFPPKPDEVLKKPNINSSLISLLLFIGGFYLIFRWDITYILVITGVIFIHEMGHYFAMKMFNYKDLGIFFVPMIGALATGTKDNISQRQRVVVLLAGPLPGVVIGLIIYYFGLREANDFLLRLSQIFILINLFNLLPVMPLDGGRMLKSMFFENNDIISNLFIFISIVLLTYFSIKSASYFLLIIPFALLMQLNSQAQIKKVRKAIADKGLDIDRSYSELSDEEYWLIRDEIGRQMNYYNRLITPGNYVVSQNENRIIKQVRLIIQKKPVKDLRIFGKVLFTVLWLLTFIVPLIVIAFYYIRLGKI